MNERVRFIAAFLESEKTFVELCEDFGISRKQGYKWRQRYEEGGVTALVERSRAPHSHPHAVSNDLAAMFVAARQKHPRWGPRKLLVLVQRQHPSLMLPAASTVGEILKKAGLVGRRKRIRRSEPYRARMGGYDAPNAVWCANFKGHFPVDNRRCRPLTASYPSRLPELEYPEHFRIEKTYSNGMISVDGAQLVPEWLPGGRMCWPRRSQRGSLQSPL